MVQETDIIVENEVHIIVAEAEDTIRITIIMVIEIIDPEMENIKQTIGIMIYLIIGGNFSVQDYGQRSRNMKCKWRMQ